jgi:pimeloyl-ACP methyl ester carboxylesterase
MTRLRRLLLGALGVVAIGYIGAIALLKWQEPALVFAAQLSVVHPAQDSAMHPITLRSTAGDRLEAVRMAPLSAAGGPRWVLFLHGNASSIWDSVGQRHEILLQQLGYGVLAPDYRGYGRSTGTPTERGLADDAMTAWRYLTDSLRVPAKHIMIVGHSLGAGVATELATHVQAEGLVLIGAFTSVPDLGAEMYPFFPVRWVASAQFANIEKLPRVEMPIAIISAGDDRTIPFRHGMQLYQVAPAPKRFYPVRGGHVEGGFNARGLGSALEWIQQQPPRMPTYASGTGRVSAIE